MGNHPTLDCNKHNNQAKKCKQLKEVYKIDSQCSHNVNHKQPKVYKHIFPKQFDSTYDKIKKCETKINHYLNACNHVMRHHNDDLLNGHLNELHKHNCDLNKCMMLRRNYRQNKFSEEVILKYINDTQRTKHNDDIRQMLFFQAVESMHEYLCHNKNDKKYFIQKRNLIKQLSPAYYNNLTSRYVGINNQNEFEEKFTPHTKENKKPINGGYESESISISTTSLSMFSSKSCKSVHSQSKNVKKYENGRQWIYKTDKKHKKSYVGCHYINLQQELHEECRLSKRVWKGFIMKSKQLQETHEVKRIRHRINMDKSLSTIRVLILFIYTSYEKFQKRLNELARVTCNLNKMDERKAKKQHSKLGHSFKMLIETVQNYGLINNNLNSISIVYRGLSIIPLFSKYLLTCHSPCSTSRSYPAAVTFAGLDNNAAAGSVLELSVPNGSIYFDMQFISIYKLEFELLFYGLNSFLCMEQLYIEYICKNKINLTPMILLEKITGASYPIKYTNEYKESENILNELLNNEYKEEKNENDISLQKEFKYFIEKKRMLVLKNERLMKILNGNILNKFDKKYLDICKIIKIFKHTRYLMIVNSYNINIECIVQFCVSNKGETFENKLRSIELDHKYNKTELNKIQNKLGEMWNKNSLWEPFFEEHCIKFKKDIINSNNNCNNNVNI